MTRSYFRNCQGSVIVFDLTNQQSLDAVERYIQVFKEEAPYDAQDNIVLVGTKLDDVENRKVSNDDALAICNKFGCVGYFETSSQTGEGVDEAFFALAGRAFQKDIDMVSRGRSIVARDDDGASQTSGAFSHNERSKSMAEMEQ